MRAVRDESVQGKEFVFPYPAIGPGFFVIRCVSNKKTQIFVEDPWHQDLAIRHFKFRKRICHEETGPKTYTNEEIVRKFGYAGKPRYLGPVTGRGPAVKDLHQPTAVIDSEGDDVDGDWVARSNAHLPKEAERRKAASLKAQSLPAVGYTSTRRKTPPPEVFNWAGASTAVSPSFAAPATARSETAGRCNGTGIPEADMDLGGLLGPRPANVGSGNWDQRDEEEGEMFQVCRSFPPLSTYRQHKPLLLQTPS